MAFAVVSIPQPVIAVVVGIVVCAFAMLMVLHPLTLIALTVEEGIDSPTLTPALDVLALKGIAILPCRFAFAVRLAGLHFTLVHTTVFHHTRTECDFLRTNRHYCRQKENKNVYCIFYQSHDYSVFFYSKTSQRYKKNPIPQSVLKIIH